MFFNKKMEAKKLQKNRKLCFRFLAQVCLHIVQAIKKESSRMRDDWEVSLCSGAAVATAGDDLAVMPDTYCFEMLSLVLALSGR
jgi:hypothetical protein